MGSLMAQAGGEVFRDSQPHLIPAQNPSVPSASAWMDSGSDVPEAPWVPPISASQVGDSYQGESPPEPNSPTGSRNSEGRLRQSESSSFMGPREDQKVSGESWEKAWTPFLPPSPLPSHEAHPRENGSRGDSALPIAVLESKVWAPAWGSSAWPVQNRGLGQERSIHLERIARQADQHTRRGFELAGRRAYFSARAEFLNALRLMAEGLDKEYRTQRHSQALARGLTALDEADDFLLIGAGGGEYFDLRTMVAGHSTPILQESRLENLTAMEAMQRYFSYAQEQLALAAGQEVAGSMALHGLGKLYAALADQSALGLKAAQSKAMVFYQAALLVDSKNFMAANDLGVLLARGGWYEEAKAALAYSLRIHSHAVGWRNLAVVYREMGQYDLALQAARQWRQLRQQEQSAAKDPAQSAEWVVQWVPPERFAAGTGDGLTPPPKSGEASSAKPGIPASAAKDSFAAPVQKGSFPSPGSSSKNVSPPPQPENKPRVVLSNFLRGPLSLFRMESPEHRTEDESSSRLSSESALPNAIQRPSPSPAGKAQFR